MQGDIRRFTDTLPNVTNAYYTLVNSHYHDGLHLLCLLLVDDPYEWHVSNSTLNPSHYTSVSTTPSFKTSLLNRLGFSQSDVLQSCFLGPVRMNSHDPFRKLILHYTVHSDSLSDDDIWTTSPLSPVLLFATCPNLRVLYPKPLLNLVHIRSTYLAVCILSLPQQFSLQQLFYALTLVPLEQYSDLSIQELYLPFIRNLIKLRLISQLTVDLLERSLDMDIYEDFLAFMPAKLQKIVVKKTNNNLSSSFLLHLDHKAKLFKRKLLCNNKIVI
ncbi:hypothetical protein P9112_013754 [Eukaryota sp. TZLM1-RC]